MVGIDVHDEVIAEAVTVDVAAGVGQNLAGVGVDGDVGLAEFRVRHRRFLLLRTPGRTEAGWLRCRGVGPSGC